jgi:hypothetical protein
MVISADGIRKLPVEDGNCSRSKGEGLEQWPVLKLTRGIQVVRLIRFTKYGNPATPPGAPSSPAIQLTFDNLSSKRSSHRGLELPVSRGSTPRFCRLQLFNPTQFNGSSAWTATIGSREGTLGFHISSRNRIRVSISVRFPTEGGGLSAIGYCLGQNSMTFSLKESSRHSPKWSIPGRSRAVCYFQPLESRQRHLKQPYLITERCKKTASKRQR